ncbi:xanthine dehydrogenase family protein molybdopterin-binding subunit [Deinococcus altitudinis]|uniref:xanthine dehydrogenase family protein molybdopterin-binding subunit n=1 Tax=Deinococcus altitudinis TaxID=468914 RepID=UPI003891D278
MTGQDGTSPQAPAPYVGGRVSRIDGPAKVRGEAKFTADFSPADLHPSGLGAPSLVHALMVTATIASGRISGTDQAAARAVPGVLDILTHETPGLKLSAVEGYPKGPAGTSFLPLQDAGVKFRGQPVALILAESLEAAKYAAMLLKIEYAAQPFRGTLAQARDGEPLLGRETPEDLQHSRGDVQQGLNDADTRFGAKYETPVHHHNPMEMHAVTAQWEEGAEGKPKVTLHEPTQWMQSSQGTLAKVLGLEPDDVHVLSPYVGGGFGSKATTWPHLLMAVLAARHLNRPVKLVLTRAQMFAAVGYRAATSTEYQVGLDVQGRLSAMSLKAETQTGPVDQFPEQVGTVPKMLYANPNMEFTHDLIRTHAGPNIMMRAPGEASGGFGLEVLMDELAEAAGLDPLEFRRVNHAPSGQDPESGLPYSSKHLLECYERGAAAFGWERRSRQPGSMRDGHTLIGWGMASAVYPVYSSPATARARMKQGGQVVIEAGSHDIGTGTYSVLAQIAADALGVRLEQVTVKLGDSRLPKNGYSGGSRTAGSVGSAVLAASMALRQELLAAALADPSSPLAGATTDEIQARDGGLYRSGSDQGEPYGTVLARMGKTEHEAYREVIPNEGTPEDLEKLLKGEDGSVEAIAKEHARYSWGAVFAEVRVDPDFMTPRVSRMVGVYDIGQVLNAKTAESQLIGGMIWGVGMALHEETQVDPATGLVLNSNLADYHLPVNADLHQVQAITLAHPDFLVSLLGARGAGEIGIVGTAAAVANAIYHATGKRVRETPITLDKLMG